MNFTDKVFIVTGAGSGIGKALVVALLKRGAKVGAVDLKDDGLKDIITLTGTEASRFVSKACDISDKTAVENLIETFSSAFGQVDGIINCAGIIQPFVRVNDLSYEAIERVMKVNFYGTLYLVKSFLPMLLSRPEASIVTVSSMGGFLPVPGQSVYGASKAAVKLFTEGLFAELMETNVHVSVVFPGATKTNITENSHVITPNVQPNDAKKIPMLSAEAVAEKIIRGMEKKKLYIYTGKDSNFMNRMYRLAPLFSVKMITRKMKGLLG